MLIVLRQFCDINLAYCGYAGVWSTDKLVRRHRTKLYKTFQLLILHQICWTVDERTPNQLYTMLSKNHYCFSCHIFQMTWSDSTTVLLFIFSPASSTVPKWVHHAVAPVVKVLDLFIPQPYAGEIRGLASHFGGSLSDIIILNFAYEMTAYVDVLISIWTKALHWCLNRMFSDDLCPFSDSAPAS